MWEEIQHQIYIENQPRNADLGRVCYDWQFDGKFQFDESCEKYILERNHFACTVSGKRFNTKGIGFTPDYSYKEKPSGEPKTAPILTA